MKTTQGKVVKAFNVLATMSSKPMNSFAAYKLFRLKKALTPVVEFQSEQEYKLIEELGGTIDQNGRIHIEDKEKQVEFITRHQELEKMECEIETEKISMFPKELPDISLSDMESLEEFIEWKE